MRTFVEYGLTNAAAATAFAVVALLVGLLVRRPAVRNALWILVFVRLLLPPIWTFDLAIAERQSIISIATVAKDEPTILFPVEGDPLEPLADGMWHLDEGLALDAPAAADVVPSSVAASSTEAHPADTNSWIYVWLAVLWIAGSLFVAVRAARRVLRFQRALRDTRPAPTAIQEDAEALACSLGLRRCPTILLAPGRVWPSLWMPGLLPRGAILIIPAGLLPLLDPAQRSAVIAHELAHLRRGDPWVRWLEVLTCVIYWWHPLLWWFRRKLRQAEEECCDMWVVGATSGRKAYATALVETAAFLSGPDLAASPALASGAGPVRNLQRRVTMIMRATWPARLTRLGLALVLGVGGLGLAFGPALAQPERKEDPKRDVERPKERPDKERPGDRPREGDRDRGGDREVSKEVQAAREAVEKARQEARAAMMRLQEAEAALAKAEGRRFPGAGRDGFPGFPGRPDRGPGDRGPGDRDPARRGFEGFPRLGGEFRDLQAQIEELRRAMEEMRREMRRGVEGRGAVRPKDGDRPREGDRPKEGDRRRDGGENPPKRPVERDK